MQSYIMLASPAPSYRVDLGGKRLAAIVASTKALFGQLTSQGSAAADSRLINVGLRH